MSEVRGVGPVRCRQLETAGVKTVLDLLQVVPSRFEDRREIGLVGEIRGPGRYTLRGHLRDLKRIHLRRRGMSLVRGIFSDSTGDLEAIWFNRPYLVQQTRSDTEYLVHGEVRRKDSGWQLVNASVEAIEAAEQGEETASSGRFAGRIVPIYQTTGGIGHAAVSRLIAAAVEASDLENTVDWMPRSLLERHCLPPLGKALAELHRPADDADVGALDRRTTPAHGRLAYGELLELQVELALVRRRRVRAAKRHSYRHDTDALRRVRAILPFELTAAQRRVFDEVVADLTSAFPMTRLLQGDVGSGKTIVAAMALVLAAESGLQSALMAPTELLAEQHYRALKNILGSRYPLALLTGSAADRAESRAALAAGELPIVVGTHALIQEGVVFRRPGLVVIDEQHRFGVGQRSTLQEKGEDLDLLVMTATPIPRSLALTVHGDLEVSVIDELPPGRTPVETLVLPAESRPKVYDQLGEQLAAGGQAYVVCPLIEASKAIAATSIEGLEEEIHRRFAAYRPLVLHGATPADERDRIMSAFAAGDSRFLLATTIIEVGVDVPAATLMVIESAERFGLSQLHQLRGRVGRGSGRGLCIALHGPLGDDARRRLDIFGETVDGFAIAEADLKIRGPGDFLGTRQAGKPLLRIASIVEDRDWLEKARDDARAMVEASGLPDTERLLERVSANPRFTGGGLAGG